MNKKATKTTGLTEQLKGKLPVLLVLAVVVGGAWVMINQSKKMRKGLSNHNLFRASPLDPSKAQQLLLLLSGERK